jgi:outer membrane receptor protein involved in Fe transport
VVRPDLREVADVIYIDPELDIRVQGNPTLRPSPIDNLELRSEFYYDSGNNFTMSLFYKDIQAPIEQIRSAGSDDDVVLGFTNAESGEVYGIEVEGLKSLPRGLFLSGNATISDSNIQIDRNLSSVLTNFDRRLTGHSKWVVNTTLGWDSPSAMHSAYLNYNAFGERIFFAGTAGNDDAYEQPFHSLGIVYKWFPSDSLSLEFSVDNILDEEREFLQRNAGGNTARIIVQEVGTEFGASMRWMF